MFSSRVPRPAAIYKRRASGARALTLRNTVIRIELKTSFLFFDGGSGGKMIKKIRGHSNAISPSERERERASEREEMGGGRREMDFTSPSFSLTTTVLTSTSNRSSRSDNLARHYRAANRQVVGDVIYTHCAFPRKHKRTQEGKEKPRGVLRSLARERRRAARLAIISKITNRHPPTV